MPVKRKGMVSRSRLPSRRGKGIPSLPYQPKYRKSTRATGDGILVVTFAKAIVDILSGRKRNEYQEYIRSDAWRRKAREIRARDGHQCKDCGKTGISLDVHHLTYAHLGNEEPEDLITLCRACHKRRHRAISKMKKARGKR